MPDPASAAWLLPAAKELYAHRKEIGTVWARISNWILGKRLSVAFTGMSGAGKTVLFDHLTGKAPRAGYVPPGRSVGADRGRVRFPGKRAGLTVIPGQASRARLMGLEELFSEAPGIDGIVHVVSNGFVEIREHDTPAVLREKGLGDLDAFLGHQRSEELRDLGEVLRHVERSCGKFGKPAWILVAVAKYDLYYDREGYADVIARYTGCQSPFRQLVDEYQNRIGHNHLQWEAIPVATYLDAFAWPGGEFRPRLTEPERDHFLARFAAVLEHYCGTSAG